MPPFAERDDVPRVVGIRHVQRHERAEAPQVAARRVVPRGSGLFGGETFEIQAPSRPAGRRRDRGSSARQPSIRCRKRDHADNARTTSDRTSLNERSRDGSGARDHAAAPQPRMNAPQRAFRRCGHNRHMDDTASACRARREHSACDGASSCCPLPCHCRGCAACCPVTSPAPEPACTRPPRPPSGPSPS